MFLRANLFSLALVICSALVCGGCALIPLDTLSTVLGMASSAASTGPEVYRAGKLETALMIQYPQLLQNARAAAADLRLHIARDRSDSKSPDNWDFKLRDDRGAQIEITVQRRSPMLCRCRVDVGFFGSEPTAKVILRQIESHQSPPGPPTTRIGLPVSQPTTNAI
jgi:hypothetical protein